MADDTKSPRTKKAGKADDKAPLSDKDKPQPGSDDGWKNIKPADDKTSSQPRGKGHYKINDVDLTEYLPIPLHFSFGETEKKAMAEFRERSKRCTPAHTDYYISRYLVARKWDMKKSVDLFDESMNWRDQNKVDDILETFPDNYWYKQLLEYWPTSISIDKPHLTKDGCPVMYERIGMVGPKMCDLIPRETLFKHHLYNIEIMERYNNDVAEKNGFSPGTILIEDLDHLNHSHLYAKVTGLIQEISASDEAHNPESIRKVYIVNPPTIFGLVWGIMKPFIEERTLQKFSFGSTKDFALEWDAIIGKENLPKFLGGSMDWDPPTGGACKHMVPPDLVKKEIPRREELFVEITANKGQIIHWQVMCHKDINLALFHKTGSSSKDRKAVPEWPNKKYEPDLSPHHGWYTLPEEGTYILHIDNTDSWALSRKVKYFTYVKDPLVLKRDKADQPKEKETPVKKEKKDKKDKREGSSKRADRDKK